MDNQERLTKINQTLEALHTCFRGMDLPDHRKMNKTLDNLKWLDKNMGARNAKHPKYAEAKEYIRTLIEELKYS
jgi:hypothetical protein